MWKDPIVEEIHEIRRQIAAEQGNDMQRIGAYFMTRQKERERHLVSYPPRRPDGWVAPSVYISTSATS